MNYPGVIAGSFVHVPAGIILHGSRSGAAGNPTTQEYLGTARYAVDEPGGLGWSATIGDDVIAIHMGYSQWGWNARGCSSIYAGVEFAQATEAEAISDAQVRAFCWYVQQVRGRWPSMPLNFPTHAELDGTAQYGGTYDGKTDCFSRGSARTTDLRNRIYARLGQLGIH